MDSDQKAELIISATARIRERVEKRLVDYCTERSYQKLREWEMANIASEECAVELVQFALDLQTSE